MSAATPLVDDYVFLIGRAPVSEYLAYRQKHFVAGTSADERTWLREWRAAREHVHALQTSEAGLADDVPLQPLPDYLTELAAAQLRDPVLLQAYPDVAWRWVWLELDRLVVYQKHVNLSYVDSLRAELPAPPSETALAQFAMGMGQRQASTQTRAHPDNSFSFHSLSTDLRCLDILRVDPATIRGVQPSGYATAAVCVFIGFGANVLTAVRVKGRVILGNGTHRAYTLRAQGVTHAPFLIADLSREEDFELAAMSELKQNPARYLQTPRPSLFKDYFDARLHQRLQVPRESMSLHLKCEVQISKIPLL